jgi:hypothetical protein
MNIYYYFTNLDNKSRTYLFLGFCFVFLIFKNFFILTYQTFFALVICVVIFYFIITHNMFNLNNDLNKIKDYNNLLNLDSFTYLPQDISLVVIYNDLYKFGKVDKYDFVDSLKATERLLEIYNKLLSVKYNYKQLIELAEEERDNALNHLQCINNSIEPTNVILVNKTIINRLESKQLNENIHKLSNMLNNYIFEMYRLSRKYYENENISTTSFPITYNIANPLPKPNNDVLKNNFNIYYGTVRP